MDTTRQSAISASCGHSGSHPTMPTEISSHYVAASGVAAFPQQDGQMVSAKEETPNVAAVVALHPGSNQRQDDHVTLALGKVETPNPALVASLHDPQHPGSNLQQELHMPLEAAVKVESLDPDVAATTSSVHSLNHLAVATSFPPVSEFRQSQRLQQELYHVDPMSGHMVKQEQAAMMRSAALQSGKIVVHLPNFNQNVKSHCTLIRLYEQ